MHKLAKLTVTALAAVGVGTICANYKQIKSDKTLDNEVHDVIVNSTHRSTRI